MGEYLKPTLMQRKGMLVVPQVIRNELGLEHGSPVDWFKGNDGWTIRPAVSLDEALDRIGNGLKAKGISQEELMTELTKARGEIVNEQRKSKSKKPKK
jgi:bifunctional DNA-binding transcriptional regulator/antitoxin component of YhaV-PrlF toxin-antitoxin module